MSGSRAKALRRAFRAEHGRSPQRTRWRGLYSYVPSEWRRVKKAHARRART